MLHMLTLRFTIKAFKKFKQKPQIVEVDTPDDDFGQWYVNSVDCVKRVNILAVMHAESLYTMLIPVERKMDLSDFVHTVFANLLLRMLRLDIPRTSADSVISSYDGHAVVSKTNSRSLVGSLSTIIKEIDVLVEWPDDFLKGDKLDLVKLEHAINDAPRTLGGKTVWPLESFYKCIRQLCPELPARKPLPFHFTAMGKPERIMGFFNDKVPDALATKVEVSTIGAEILFDLEEVSQLHRAVCQPRLHVSDGSVDFHSILERMLRHQIKRLESQQ